MQFEPPGNLLLPAHAHVHSTHSHVAEEVGQSPRHMTIHYACSNEHSNLD